MDKVSISIGYDASKSKVVVIATDYHGVAGVKNLDGINILKKEDLDKYKNLEDFRDDWKYDGSCFFKDIFPPHSKINDILTPIINRASVDSIVINLNVDSRLAYMPWELMVVGDHALVNHPYISIVRTVINSPAKENLYNGKPVLFFITSNPFNDLTELIINSIKTAEKSIGKYIEVISIIGNDTESILEEKTQEVERERRPIIGIHFLGHGGINKENGSHLIFQDSKEPTKRSLKHIHNIQSMFSRIRFPDLTFAFFEACHTGTFVNGNDSLAASLADDPKIPWIIGMKYKIDKDKAQLYFDGLYRGLGRELDDKFSRNRSEHISLNNCLQIAKREFVGHAFPVIYLSLNAEEVINSLHKNKVFDGKTNISPPNLGEHVDKVKKLIEMVGVVIRQDNNHAGFTIFDAHIPNIGNICVGCNLEYDKKDIEYIKKNYLKENGYVKCYLVPVITPPYKETQQDSIEIFDYYKFTDNLTGIGKYLSDIDKYLD